MYVLSLYYFNNYYVFIFLLLIIDKFILDFVQSL